MIEAPEAAYLARQLAETLTGKTVVEVYTNSSPHKFAWFHGDPEEYTERLAGKKITGAHSQGGLVEITADKDTRLVLTDGVYVPWLSKDTAGKSCTRCDEPIRKENYLGGSIYYCSECQPL